VRQVSKICLLVGFMQSDAPYQCAGCVSPEYKDNFFQMSSDAIVSYSVFVVKNAFIDTIGNKCAKNIIRLNSMDFDKKALSERDICTKYITPAIVQTAGWDLHTQIREEVTFTAVT
jgi:hypothetical protein